MEDLRASVIILILVFAACLTYSNSTVLPWNMKSCCIQYRSMTPNVACCVYFFLQDATIIHRFCNLFVNFQTILHSVCGHCCLNGIEFISSYHPHPTPPPDRRSAAKPLTADYKLIMSSSIQVCFNQLSISTLVHDVHSPFYLLLWFNDLGVPCEVVKIS